MNKQISYFETAKEILSKFKELGYEAYICGGAVRDLLAGYKLHDIDITTNCPMSTTEKMFRTIDIGQSKTFGLVTILYNGYSFEVANFRTESNYSDGRHPDKIEIAESFEEDSNRRDFTINSMGMCSNEGVVDFHNGMKDLADGILRTVGDPEERFSEDYLRMLRAIRFAVKFNFTIDDKSSNAIKKNAEKITKICPERIFQELEKMASFTGEQFAECIILMDKLSILKYILPEISEMKNFFHTVNHHPEGAKVKNIKTGKFEKYDPKNKEHKTPEKFEIFEGSVFDHVMAALSVQKEKNNPLLNFCVLFHDTGKVKTYVPKGEKKTYHGHDKASIEINQDICNRLKMSNLEKDTIIFASENHMKFHKLLEMKSSKIAYLITSKKFDYLFKTAYCDDSCREGVFDPLYWSDIEDKIQNVQKLIDENPFYGKVNGKYIIEKLNIEPGPVFGIIIKKTKEYILDKQLNDEKIVIQYMKGIYSNYKNTK